MVETKDILSFKHPRGGAGNIIGVQKEILYCDIMRSPNGLKGLEGRAHFGPKH